MLHISEIWFEDIFIWTLKLENCGKLTLISQLFMKNQAWCFPLENTLILKESVINIIWYITSG